MYKMYYICNKKRQKIILLIIHNYTIVIYMIYRITFTITDTVHTVYKICNILVPFGKVTCTVQ